jgi:hypothetical protein
MQTSLITLVALILLASPAAAQSFLEMAPGTYQEHHPYLEYHGQWEVVSNDAYTDNAAIFTTDPNAWVRFTVRGPATLYRTVGPGYGSFELCLNADPCTTISNESAATSHRMPVVLSSEAGTESTTITLRAAGATLNIDQVIVDGTTAGWPMPTPWPTPNATPFINTWDEGTELALHAVNAWIWINQNGVGPNNNRIQIFDALAFGLMLGVIFTVLAGAIQRVTGGRKNK